jgi:hypothetical protein
MTDGSVTPEQSSAAISGLTAIGRYLFDHPDLPWLLLDHGHFSSLQSYKSFIGRIHAAGRRLPVTLDEITCLGFVSSIYMCTEMAMANRREVILQSLLNLPVPVQFRHVLQNWVGGNVNFVEMRTR